MRAFSLHRPTSLDEAVGLLAAGGTHARVLAGGTDLVAGVMRDQIIGRGMPYPSDLVDISTVTEMAGIRVTAEAAVIGAGTPLAQIAESAELRRTWPLLAAAVGEVASPEIRAIGTLGGNLHQRPRCWFFRSKDFDCIKKGGDICFAVKGDNRYNAILDGNLCFIVHPSDAATALLALGAQARVASPRGERIIPFDEYFIGPETDLLRESVLLPDELLVEVILPVAAAGSRMAWAKMNEKDAPTWDFALASAAIVAQLSGGTWQSGRVVLGAVAPTPYLAGTIESILHGRDVRDALPEAVGEVRRLARPMRHNAFKVNLAEEVLQRALLATLAADPVEPPSDGSGATG